MAVCTIYYIPETGTIRVFFPFRPMHTHPVLPRTIVGGAKRTRYYKHIDCISAGNLDGCDYVSYIRLTRGNMKYNMMTIEFSYT